MSHKPTTRLTVVTVLYRSGEMLRKTLPTWAASARGHAVDFVFVDNSPGDAAQIIAECFGDISYQYLPDPTNPGFAAGANRGVQAATAQSVVLLNPDVWLHEDSITRMLEAVGRTPDVPIAVGLAMHGTDYVGIDLHPISLFIDRRSESARGPLGPSGGAAILPVSLFEALGGLDESMFAWGEDADFAFRAYSAGLRTGVLDLSLPHAWGHSVEGDASLSEFRSYLLARNRLLVAWRNLTLPLLVLLIPLLVVAHAGLAVRRARQGLLSSFAKGVLHGTTRGPAARRRRVGTRFGIRLLLKYVSVRSAS